MKKTKHILALLLAALLLLAAACSSGQGDSARVKQTLEPTSMEPATGEPTDEPDLARKPTPEPTDEPTSEPTQEQTKERPSEEWFIEQAWPAAQRVGEVFGFKPRRENPSVLFSERTPSVSFGASGSKDILGVSICFLDYKEPNEFSIIMFGSSLNYAYEYSEAKEKEIRNWWEFWREQRIVVTPEDIVTAGCTETEGDEYMLTVSRLCTERMAELFKGAPEGCPVRCKEAVATRCEYQELPISGYSVSIALIPEDPMAYTLFLDNDLMLFEDEAHPELWGWGEYRGVLMLERDGENWIAKAWLDLGG